MTPNMPHNRTTSNLSTTGSRKKPRWKWRIHSRVVMIALSFLLVAVAAACGGDGDDETATATPQLSSPTDTLAERACEIAFAGDVRSEPSGHRIYCVNADGTDLQPLTDVPNETFGGETYEAFPAWSPDGSQVAFTRTGSDGGVFIVNADGSGEQRILEGWARDISWSPDGDQLVLSWLEQGWPPSPDEFLQLVGVDPDGTNLSVLNDAPELREGPVTDLFASWSPDGSRILFQHWVHAEQAEEDVIELYVVNADGAGLRQIETGDLAVYYSSSWTPDGEAVAFGGGNPDDPMDVAGIYAVSLEGGEPERLTPPNLGMFPSAFDWSPDGSRVTYVTTFQELDVEMDPAGIDWELDLVIVEIASGDVQRVTETADVDELNPIWSPVGGQLFFASLPPSVDLYSEDGEGDFALRLAVINEDGTGEVTLIEGIASVGERQGGGGWRPLAE